MPDLRTKPISTSTFSCASSLILHAGRLSHSDSGGQRIFHACICARLLFSRRTYASVFRLGWGRLSDRLDDKVHAIVNAWEKQARQPVGHNDKVDADLEAAGSTVVLRFEGDFKDLSCHLAELRQEHQHHQNAPHTMPAQSRLSLGGQHPMGNENGIHQGLRDDERGYASDIDADTDEVGKPTATDMETAHANHTDSTDNTSQHSEVVEDAQSTGRQHRALLGLAMDDGKSDEGCYGHGGGDNTPTIATQLATPPSILSFADCKILHGHSALRHSHRVCQDLTQNCMEATTGKRHETHVTLDENHRPQ
mmetsp:Transcript_60347/g.143793  ORF Transcript_60347/g.143793 Transcript_60347/m.143793 type:complete len:308 (-) Transcript_60347:141-1064(-)